MCVCFVNILCCQVKRSLHRTDHSSTAVLLKVVCLTKCDREATIMKWPSPTRCCRIMDILVGLMRDEQPLLNMPHKWHVKLIHGLKEQ